MIMRDNEGKFIKGTDAISPYKKGRINENKGKTYEEIYGIEKAKQIKEQTSNSHKGQKGYWAGKKRKFSEEHKIKMKKGIKKHYETNESKLKGKHNSPENEFKKGHPAWNKGKSGYKIHTEEQKEILRKRMSGENNPSWNGGKTSLVKLIRSSKKMAIWRKTIFERDNYTCQECGDNYGGNLNAHHFKSFNLIFSDNSILTRKKAYDCKELWDLDNGITACEVCHNELHRVGGY